MPSEMRYDKIGVCENCGFEEYLNVNNLCLECEEMEREQAEEAAMLADEEYESFGPFEENYPDDAEDSHLESAYEDLYADSEADLEAGRWDFDAGEF